MAPSPVGFILDVADAPESCGDDRTVVAKASGSGQVIVNGEPVASIDKAVSRIHEVMSYRAEKVIYVEAEAGASWLDFLELVDRVWAEAEVISLVTPRIDVLARKRICLVPSCGTCEKLRSVRVR
jgi:hypothetical protein